MDGCGRVNGNEIPAVSLVGEMIRSLSADRQVIVATRSPLLVDVFDIDEIITSDLTEGRSEPRILDRSEYDGWREGFSTGELWQKNLFGGHPLFDSRLSLRATWGGSDGTGTSAKRVEAAAQVVRVACVDGSSQPWACGRGGITGPRRRCRGFRG